MFNGFYDRMYGDFKNFIIRCKDVNLDDDNLYTYRIIITFIEYQQHLPEKYIKRIFAKFGEADIFKDIVNKVASFPPFIVNIFEPETVFKFVKQAWNHLQFKTENIKLELVENSPLLNTFDSRK